MKVLLINGSPRLKGNTATALNEMVKVFNECGVESEIVNVGAVSVPGCIACRKCRDTNKCIYDDIVNETLPKFAKCDAMVIGSPVYYSMPSGNLVSFLQRLFQCSGNIDKRMKVGASIVSARRAGTTATFEQLNQFFTISQMPVASGRYWNNIFGESEGECINDEEGLQNARILARNIIFLMKAIADAKDKYGLPEMEDVNKTNFIKR